MTTRRSGQEQKGIRFKSSTGPAILFLNLKGCESVAVFLPVTAENLIYGLG